MDQNAIAYFKDRAMVNDALIEATKAAVFRIVLIDDEVADILAREVLAVIAPAVLEEAARYIDGDGDKAIPGAAVFAPMVSGNRQPCMSGDPRDRLLPHIRRQFDDGITALSDAIRALKARYV